jgi:HSP20 family protein
MVSLERPDPHVDGPEPRASASATASASASASAGVLWGSWRSFADRLRSRVERGPWGLPSLAGGGRRENPLRVEEYAEENAQVVRVELPGIDPDNDIEISVSGGLLHIRVERRETAASKHSYRSEFRYGSLTRSVPLPAGASGEDIGAEYRHGILQVRVPVGEQPPPGQRIPISRG